MLAPWPHGARRRFRTRTLVELRPGGLTRTRELDRAGSVPSRCPRRVRGVSELRTAPPPEGREDCRQRGEDERPKSVRAGGEGPGEPADADRVEDLSYPGANVWLDARVSDRLGSCRDCVTNHGGGR